MNFFRNQHAAAPGAMQSMPSVGSTEALTAPLRALKVPGSSASPSSSGNSSPPAPAGGAAPRQPAAAPRAAERDDSPRVAGSEASVGNAAAAPARAAAPGGGQAGWDVELGATRASKKGRGLMGSAKVQPVTDASAAAAAPRKVVLKSGGGVSIPSSLLSLALLSAMVFYFYVRVAFTLDTGALGYSIFVLVVEVLAATSMLPHLIYLLPKKVKYADPLTVPVSECFHVRVLIPCYTEALEIVRPTLLAVANATLPKGCIRTIYMCDDGKDAGKEAWVEGLNRTGEAGCPVVYIRGHPREPGEVNGKSGNLNNALSNVLYPGGIDPGSHEVVSIVDADMVLRSDFYQRTLPYLQTERDAMVLAPQEFHNYNPATDIFCHSNRLFWDVTCPGIVDGFGGVMCTGTNYAVRSRALLKAGGYPSWTLGEDVRLGVELQRHGYTGYFLPDRLAVGEVPDTVRGVFMQRSRWCKGNLQNTFSRDCTLFDSSQPIMLRILWNAVTWHYLTCSVYTPTFLLVPILAILVGIFPIALNRVFALAFTLYFCMQQIVLYSRVRSFRGFQDMFFQSLTPHIFWYSFVKANFQVLRNLITQKQNKPFKTTIKTMVSGSAQMAKTEQTSIKKVKDHSFSWSTIQDLWAPAVFMVVNLLALGYGGWRLHRDGLTTTNLALIIGMLWAAINAMPPYLLLHLQVFGDHLSMVIACTLAGTLMTVFTFGVIAAMWLLSSPTGVVPWAPWL